MQMSDMQRMQAAEAAKKVIRSSGGLQIGEPEEMKKPKAICSIFS